jgi:precorrin-6B methylase 2
MVGVGRRISQKLLLAVGAARPFNHSAMARRKELTAELSARCGNAVIGGPFAGMLLPDMNPQEDGDRAPKLLGTYEENLHSCIAKAVAQDPDLVINVGSAEGYFAIGLARLLPKATVHAFDIDPSAVEACAKAGSLNGVSDRLFVHGAYRAETLTDLIKDKSKALIFMDCEGAEVELLDPALAPKLSVCDIIVETHDLETPNAMQILEGRLSSTHTIERIPQGGRDPNRFSQLQSWPEMDRWLVVSETRPQGMTWLFCEAKNR